MVVVTVLLAVGLPVYVFLNCVWPSRRLLNQPLQSGGGVPSRPGKYNILVRCASAKLRPPLCSLSSHICLEEKLN